MKIILFHGTGETKDSFWLPFIKRECESRGHTVIVPAFPDNDRPALASSLPVALELSYDEGTILIGHSSGCPLILSTLEKLTRPIQKAILVAGFIEPLPADEGNNPILQSEYDWERIRSNCSEFVFVNSDNDPWGADDRQGRVMAAHLGGTLVVPYGEGHMGSDKFNQPYKEFHLLLSLIG